MIPRFLSYPALFLALLFLSRISSAQTSALSVPDSAKTDPAYSLIQEALTSVRANDMDGAKKKLDDAIKLNPHSSAALVLRGCLYGTKKQWQPAEADFRAAEFISPDDVQIKFLLADVKFSEKDYDAARLHYSALVGDPDRGELAAYNVFLCDLGAGHEAEAAKEFDAFNRAGSGASYYFGNVAWSIHHKKIQDARDWLGSAGRIYPTQKISAYIQGLLNLGYLPLPPADQ